MEGKRLLRAADAASAASSARYQRRRRLSCTELMFVYDGDKNGVIRYIGTAYGTQEWVNPVLARRIEVKASSPPSRWVQVPPPPAHTQNV